ncbi:alpha-1A adrenergic receptor [Dunckerocampus dactyliophorus]|uniref:alpha-1A adrenergic receptor n=1 Tax=Dunckerocampus dactyliophorus TaxID=161453 RepID=UPI002406E2DA|nr:alpha-1A adrenergic receptor [Dunckerocampus dactyliophorus]
MDILVGKEAAPGSVRAMAANSSQEGDSQVGLSPQPLLVVLVVLMCVGAVTGNLLVIVLVAATKTLHCVTSVLIMNLAVTDLLVGLGTLPFLALSVVKPGWADCLNLCLFVGYTSSVYCTASVLTLAAIALDRYRSIMDCLRYSSRCTLWRTCTVVLWIWLQALITCCPPLLGWSSVAYMAPMYSCAVDWASSPSYTTTMTGLSYLLPAAVILFCYVNIVKVARSHARRIHSLEDSVQRSRDPNTLFTPSQHSPSRLIHHVSGQFLTEIMSPHSTSCRGVFSFLAHSSSQPSLQDSHQHRQGVARLFLVILAFFLCWTPYIGVALIQATETAISGQTNLVPPSAVTISYFLVLLNSDFNPLLYALLSKRFQVALHGLRQKVKARLGSGRGEVDDCRISEPCTLTAPIPGPASNLDNSQFCAPVFTISADFKHHSSASLHKVCLHKDASTSCSMWQEEPCRGRRVDYLQVPCRPQEGSRLPFSAVTMAPRATFVYGQITVTVEHDV